MQPSVRADSRGEGGREGRGGEGRGGEGREGEGRGGRCVRADAPCFTPGNFKKDAIVRPSHGRPHGRRLIVRPSVRKRPRDNHA
jgi:hypothetical protein